MCPSSIAELAEAVRDSGPLRIAGSGSKAVFLSASNDPASRILNLESLAGIVEYHPADQVVVAKAGTRLSDLQCELEKHGQCLPCPDSAEFGPLLAGIPGTIGGLCAMRMPHGLEAQCGGPRDWVLGMTLVRADGTVAKCGSMAVKNVAGYDVQKLIIGSRGTLAVIAEVVFRVFPLGALPTTEARRLRPYDAGPLWIQRTLRSDFESAVAGLEGRLYAVDRASSTFWSSVEPGKEYARYAGDWVLCSRPEAGCPAEDTLRALMMRAKTILDPTGKLNPGRFGFL